jgi:NADPH:quinone reductase
MRAVLLGSWGIDNIGVAEVADPAPGPGEVVIAAEAATVNPADLGMVTGQFASFLPESITAPYTPGWDLAGRIVAVGDGADPSVVGSRAVGFSNWVEAGHGTQASLVALPLGGGSVALAKDGLASGDALQRLVDMATAGQLHTPVARQFPADQARAAYQEFASGPHRGRIVLTFPTADGS